MTTNLIIERRVIAELREDPNNARRHDNANLAAIQASLTRFGQQKPIVIDATGLVVAGNGTLAAARALGWVDVAVVVTDLEGAAARAYALADNRTAELADWDVEQLRADLAAIEMPDIDAMFEGLDLGGDDVAPSDVDAEPKIEIADELAERWGTKLGQVWQLGRHRLMCGDSTNREDVERVMGEDLTVLVLTDPPYGMSLDADFARGNKRDVGNTYADVIGDDSPFDPRPLIEFFGECEQFWWGADWYYPRLPAGGSWMVWNKRDADGTDAIIGNHFETLWSKRHHKRRIFNLLWSGFTARNREFARSHPAEKPLSVLRSILADYSQDGAVVADPFSGSGTTIIACEQTGRACRAIEISPGYVAVALQRWADATGGVPVLL